MDERYMDSVDRRLSNLEDDRKELSKLSTLMELQIQMNKDQDEFLREQSLTLVKVNENLTSLNQVTHKLDDRIGKLEVGISSDKEKHNINIPLLIKNIIITLLTTGAIGGVTYIITQMNR